MAAAVLLLATANNVHADVIIYSNFGLAHGGNDYNPNAGYTVGEGPVSDVVEGNTFTAAQSGTLSQITVALEYTSGPNAATISLMTDLGGLPGTVLESWSVSGLPTDNGAFNTPTTVTDNLGMTLTSGTAYWIAISTGSSSTLDWLWNNTGALGNRAISSDAGATWSTFSQVQGAFRVTELDQGSAAPEPSSAALVAVALGVLAGYRLGRRRRMSVAVALGFANGQRDRACHGAGPCRDAPTS